MIYLFGSITFYTGIVIIILSAVSFIIADRMNGKIDKKNYDKINNFTAKVYNWLDKQKQNHFIKFLLRRRSQIYLIFTVNLILLLSQIFFPFYKPFEELSIFAKLMYMIFQLISVLLILRYYKFYRNYNNTLLNILINAVFYIFYMVFYFRAGVTLLSIFLYTKDLLLLAFPITTLFPFVISYVLLYQFLVIWTIFVYLSDWIFRGLVFLFFKSSGLQKGLIFAAGFIITMTGTYLLFT